MIISQTGQFLVFLLNNNYAVRLFVERVRRVRRDFSLTGERVEVGRICRLVEGMPLTIELAAVWTKTLSCVAIATELQHNLDFWRPACATYRDNIVACSLTQFSAERNFSGTFANRWSTRERIDSR